MPSGFKKRLNRITLRIVERHLKEAAYVFRRYNVRASIGGRALDDPYVLRHYNSLRDTFIQFEYMRKDASVRFGYLAMQKDASVRFGYLAEEGIDVVHMILKGFEIKISDMFKAEHEEEAWE